MTLQWDMEIEQVLFIGTGQGMSCSEFGEKRRAIMNLSVMIIATLCPEWRN